MVSDDFPRIEIDINGTLDLHHFSPKDLKELIPDYLNACHDEGIFEVRLIHGKGIGAIRRSVEAILGRLEIVKSFHLAESFRGGWGATIVTLKPPHPKNLNNMKIIVDQSD